MFDDLQVFVPGVLACSAHVEKGDTVSVSVAVERPGLDGGWSVGITRGIVLQGSESGKQFSLPLIRKIESCVNNHILHFL